MKHDMVSFRPAGREETFSVFADHVNLYAAIPPKMSATGFMGYLKGKSALMLSDLHPEYKQRSRDRHFRARGYYCETAGNVNEETIRNYIRKQTDSGRLSGEYGAS